MTTPVAESMPMDIGNLAIGLATFSIAMVSLYVAFTSNRRDAQRLTFGIGGQWIEEMRHAVAAYVGEAYAIAVAPAAERDLATLAEKGAYIRLKFDADDQRGGDVIMRTMRKIEETLEAGGRAAARREKIRTLTDEMIAETRAILEAEWKRNTN